MALDIYSGLNVTRNVNQTLSGTTANATALIDRQGYEALSVLLSTATVTDAGTASGFTMKLQHSDTTVATDFVDCASTEVFGNTTLTVTADTDDDKDIGLIGYRGGKRYVRAVITGTTNTDAVCVVRFLRGRPANASQPVTTIGSTTAST